MAPGLPAVLTTPPVGDTSLRPSRLAIATESGGALRHTLAGLGVHKGPADPFDQLCELSVTPRELSRLLESLQSGQVEKFVITKHGQMRAVVISLEQFADMRSRLRELPEVA